MKRTIRTPRRIQRPSTDRLRLLKHRLLQDWIARYPDAQAAPLDRLVTLTAGEAEALAWQTPTPLLVLPALLEEKLEGVRRYATRSSL